jgi:hypothetical protein
MATFGAELAGLRRDGERRDEAFEQERQDSRTSRRELHDKVNGVAIDLATLKGDVKAAVDNVANLKTAVEKAAPTIADVENAKKIGSMLLWFIGGGGLAIVGAVLAWGEAIKGAVSHWLGIK